MLVAAVPPSAAANCSNLVVANVTENNLISVYWGAPCSWPQNETDYYYKLSFIDTTEHTFNSTLNSNCRKEVCLLLLHLFINSHSIVINS